MLKGLLLFIPLLFSGFLYSPKLETSKNAGLILNENSRGNYSVSDVSTDLYDANEIRIYFDENKIIDEVDDSAFIKCTNLSSIMLSYSVTHINDAAIIDSLKTINYTGSEDDFAKLNITKEITINYYAYDEGFIKYWNDEIRPQDKESICDITQAEFNKIYGMYSKLLLSDKKVVDNYVDAAGAKIGDSMATLVNMFKIVKPSNNKTAEWNQSGAITLIIIISVIGMTSICVFFLLKTKQIIN